MSSVDVCLTDKRLNSLCFSLAFVSQANCLAASGSTECMLKPYLDVPGTWDASNKEFVHQTVLCFYTRMIPDACPAVDSIDRESNQTILSRCTVTPVSAMYAVLQACRNRVDTRHSGAGVFLPLQHRVISGDGNHAALKAEAAK